MMQNWSSRGVKLIDILGDQRTNIYICSKAQIFSIKFEKRCEVKDLEVV